VENSPHYQQAHVLLAASDGLGRLAHRRRDDDLDELALDDRLAVSRRARG
jgi:hypothetical protein